MDFEVKITDKNTDLRRPEIDYKDLQGTISNVFKDIAVNGDDAIVKYTQLFDNVSISRFKVSVNEIKQASKLVSNDLKKAISLAYENIEYFHRSQFVSEYNKVQTTIGVNCWQEIRPIQKIGIYIPGGTAPLFSTVLMLGIPAKIAGVKETVLCTPPDKKGNVNPVILYVADLVGITSVFKVGGIQAIAAMTYGTSQIPKVYKIFGPGNQYVTAAKQYALNLGVAIDMPAGPSELMVVADTSAKVEFVVADLLSQAEHGIDSQVVCVCNSLDFFTKMNGEINKQLQELPRTEIILQSLKNAKFIYIEGLKDTVDLINDYAPEHLILVTRNNDFYIENLYNAGSVFIGNYTPESAGDYASGTNHTLPTNAYSKSYSGVSVDSFIKKISFQNITEKGIKNIGGSIEIMAETEGLRAHKNAVSLRLKFLDKKL